MDPTSAPQLPLAAQARLASNNSYYGCDPSVKLPGFCKPPTSHIVAALRTHRRRHHQKPKLRMLPRTHTMGVPQTPLEAEAQHAAKNIYYGCATHTIIAQQPLIAPQSMCAP